MSSFLRRSSVDALLVCLVAMVVLFSLPRAARSGETARALHLEEALALARERSPALREAATGVDEARAVLAGARAYPYNPAIELEAADRRGPEESQTDRGAAVRQEVEVAGQRGKRISTTAAALAVAQARFERRLREVLADVERAFAETVRARELVAVAGADVELTRTLLSFEERRLEAGAGTQIDVNLARAAAGRAIRRAQEATATWGAARARLAEAVGLDPSTPPEAAGDLPDTPADVPPLAELTSRALRQRSDLAALRQDRTRAERRVALERSLRVPNLVLGAFGGSEEGDDILGLRAGIALPIFNRNQGEIAAAEVGVDRAQAELAVAELAVRREVAAAHAHYEAAAEALTALEGLVLATLEESLGLLRRAVEAGELSATQVLLLRRELVEAQREQIAVAGELWLARTDLEVAVEGDLSMTTTAEETSDEN